MSSLGCFLNCCPRAILFWCVFSFPFSYSPLRSRARAFIITRVKRIADRANRASNARRKTQIKRSNTSKAIARVVASRLIAFLPLIQSLFWVLGSRSVPLLVRFPRTSHYSVPIPSASHGLFPLLHLSPNPVTQKPAHHEPISLTHHHGCLAGPKKKDLDRGRGRLACRHARASVIA